MGDDSHRAPGQERRDQLQQRDVERGRSQRRHHVAGGEAGRGDVDRRASGGRGPGGAEPPNDWRSLFGAPMYSTLAGFVEPGESLEDTILREIQEEVGVTVTNLRYFGSQPWPFPSSLMIGCHARALDEALTMSSRETGLRFTLYIGDLGKLTRIRAEEMFAVEAPDPRGAAMAAIRPETT